MDDALDWFNGLSGKITITLTEPARPVSERVLNLVAPKGARIATLTLVLRAYDLPPGDPERYDAEPRELTSAEWARIVLPQREIRIANQGGVVAHVAPDPAGFSTRTLAAAIERTERETRERPDAAWIGGVDVHHIYFEGLFEEEGAYGVAWGS